ncbi:hypothetical protein [uncultured Aquimarina sp.]|uniref:hypothetical protein n=1 Tax=uncultured Aquimarina sp. TaxID=575652 RepID=UPI002632AE2A|nr:hypothetical protein [uncultured Aquimarina sp.]
MNVIIIIMKSPDNFPKPGILDIGIVLFIITKAKIIDNKGTKYVIKSNCNRLILRKKKLYSSKTKANKPGIVTA